MGLGGREGGKERRKEEREEGRKEAALFGSAGLSGKDALWASPS